MSKLKVYAIFDAAVGAYMHPMFFQSHGQVIRAWLDACNDVSTSFYKHPADYTLFQIAEYDEESGVLQSLEAKISLGTALELRSRTSGGQVAVTGSPINAGGLPEPGGSSVDVGVARSDRGPAANGSTKLNERLSEAQGDLS